MHTPRMRLSALALSATAAAAISGACAAAAIVPAFSVAQPLTRGAAPRQYRGLTSQHQPISFTLGSGHVTKLSFWVVLTCKSHHQYRVRAFGFAPITVVKARFHRAVSTAHPSASATVDGRLSGSRVTGTLRLRRYVSGEHGSCTGSSTFALAPLGHTHAGLRRQRPGTTI